MSAGPAVHTLRRAATGEVLAARVVRPASLAGRALGLLARRAVPPGEGMWLCPCNGVHTLGMRATLDVIYLNRDLRVLRVVIGLGPNRVCLPVLGAHSVVELGAGTLRPGELGPGIAVTLELAEGHGG